MSATANQHRLPPTSPKSEPAGPREIDPVEYCPVSVGTRILADRWSLLIIRDLMLGTTRFNQLHRAIPGISRSVLVSKLRHLQHHELVTCVEDESGRTGYHLTEAGEAVRDVVMAIGQWTARWRFPAPTESERNSSLLLWRMYQGIDRAELPETRVTIEFRFDHGDPAYGWIVLESGSPSFCLEPPGFDPDLRVRGSVPDWLAVWHGHRSHVAAVASGDLTIDGPSDLVRRFWRWFPLSAFAPDLVVEGTNEKSP